MRVSLILAALCAVCFTNCESGTPKNGEGKDLARLESVRAEAKIPPRQKAVETVTFTSADGVVLEGSWFAPSSDAAPAVLCLHQWRSDRSKYAAFAAQLQKEGYAVLTLDLRGHGGSTAKSDGSAVAPDRVALPDVKAALAFLRAQKTVDPSRIGIVGASYSSSNALLAAADDAGVKTLLLLSPGMNYFNVLPIEAAVKKYTGSMLAVASAKDVRSADAVKKISTLAPSKSTAQMYDDAGHGTDMFDAKVGLERVLITFLGTHL